MRLILRRLINFDTISAWGLVAIAIQLRWHPELVTQVPALLYLDSRAAIGAWEGLYVLVGLLRVIVSFFSLRRLGIPIRALGVFCWAALILAFLVDAPTLFATPLVIVLAVASFAAMDPAHWPDWSEPAGRRG